MTSIGILWEGKTHDPSRLFLECGTCIISPDWQRKKTRHLNLMMKCINGTGNIVEDETTEWKWYLSTLYDVNKWILTESFYIVQAWISCYWHNMTLPSALQGHRLLLTGASGTGKSQLLYQVAANGMNMECVIAEYTIEWAREMIELWKVYTKRMILIYDHIDLILNEEDTDDSTRWSSLAMIVEKSKQFKQTVVIVGIACDKTKVHEKVLKCFDEDIDVTV